MTAKVIRDVHEMQRTADGIRLTGKRIGVVPTMGYLHDGHLSLIRIASRHADIVITTLFVNPTQFGPKEDFARYPRDLERDLKLASDAGTHFLFAPDARQMYPEEFSTFVSVEGITAVLEGAARPGHFRGVATIVAKLFNITKPHVAVFGQKDAQQVAVLKRMAGDMNFDIDFLVGPIVREEDGLAMSSRNTYLSPKERDEAVVLAKSLAHAQKLVESGVTDSGTLLAEMRSLIESTSGKIDYISVADNATLQELEQINPGCDVLISLAVRFGATRLIDNIIISHKKK